MLLSVKSFFVGRPHSASLVPFAMLTLLVGAVGCTRIFRVPATFRVFQSFMRFIMPICIYMYYNYDELDQPHLSDIDEIMTKF